MQPVPEYQIFRDVQSYIKHYPNSTKLVVYDTPRRTRVAGYEVREVTRYTHTTRTEPLNSPDDSVRHSKAVIKDLVLCNAFDLFCTFTFNPLFVDRTDIEAVKHKMKNWLKRQNQRNGKFQYLIIPEYHADGKSIHFHALFNNYTGKLTPANSKTKSNRKIYNILSFQSGFTTAVEIDHNIEKVSSYITKYLTKDMPTFAGKKRYWCSKGLIRPVVYPDPDLDPFTLSEFTETYKNNGFAILQRPGTLEVLTNQGVQSWLIQNNY